MDGLSRNVAWRAPQDLLVHPLLKWFAFYVIMKLTARLFLGGKGHTVQEVSRRS